MRSLIFAGIQRYSLFSPNHVGNDAAIFSAVAQYLKENGHQVNMYTEQEFLTNSLKGEKCIFTMMRSKASVRKLQKLEEKEDCLIWDTNDGVPEALIKPVFEPCWLKRADFHAIHREDVTFVRTSAELQEVIAEYALRGIERVVINEHLKGDLVKFYGVAGTDFFYWFYPQEGNHSKFGLEEINGAPSGIPFSEEGLHQLCSDAAKVLDVTVYGGDCIVAPDGTIRIIDFNDWPSFAPCRQEAAKEIGGIIIRKVENVGL